MPMYEKGSVRAEPRSKQQERMKKIMKKFLSLLLALTLVLSLVVVPARAADEYNVTGLALNAKLGSASDAEDAPTTIASGTTVYFSIDADDVDVKEGQTDVDVSSVTPTYKWSDNSTNATYSTILSTENASQQVTVSCAVKYTKDSKDGTQTVSKTFTVVNAQKAFENAITSISFNGRTFAVTDLSNAKLIGTEEQIDATSFNSNLGKTNATYGTITYTYSGTTLTVKATKDATELTKQFTINPNRVSSPDFTVKGNNTSTSTSSRLTVVTGQTIELTATGYNGNTGSNISYKWTKSGDAGNIENSNRANATWTAPELKSNIGNYELTCTITDGNIPTAKTVYVTVIEDKNYAVKNGGYDSYTLTPGDNTVTINVPLISDGKDSTSEGVKIVSWVSKNPLVATVTKESNGKGTVTGVRTGSTEVVATVSYNGKPYTKSYTITVKALDIELDSITNGSYESYSDTEFARILANKISDVTGENIKTSDVTSVRLTDHDKYLTFTKDETKGASTTDLSDDFRIVAADGYIGDQTFKVRVNNKYNVTLTLNVEGDKDIKDTVTGTSANKSVTFTNSDYDYLYIYQGSASFKSSMYEGDWSKGASSGSSTWKPVKKNADYTVSSSEFSNGKATLYVVAVDDGIASTGTITVSQKSYDINYNVVAGKSVTFSQKDFESFLEDYAEDNGNYNPKKDEITFDHAVLTSSIPSAKSEGTLYYGSTEITSSNKSKTDMTDMDKVSFDSVSKPSKGTVTLTFRVYGEIEKPNSRKPDKVNYDVNVVISVVKEDITYTVGIDDTVQLTARDFVNFLQDAKTSYRKSTLDYVKFDVSGKNVSSYAYGGLYRSYSSYSTGKLADSTDKFYYEPSRTQYDLADVAYHTTRWAEAGKTVYIPFTVYGTKNEEASGTMAITIAQTMNFIDVKASDFFYEPVKWAVNNKITNGTSSTTFSPYKNCNRAEIVTFLWRAAGSPEPTVTRNPFTDVNSVRDASYYKAILWASQKGITAGSTATTFSPYQECTRSQIVTFLYRYAGKPSGYYSNPFKDVSSVNEASYYNAILWAVGKGITQGTSTTTFSPYASCTRGEAVTFLYRYVNGVK